MNNNQKRIQLVWGIALILMGIAVFIRLPQVMPRIESIEFYKGIVVYIKICFYIIGILLLFGGGRKLFLLFRDSKNSIES